MLDLSKLSTERVNESSEKLSSMNIASLIKLFNEEDINAVKCIESEFPVIEKVIELTSETLINDGRIIYIGAGTSGRLGVLDAVECPPTFGVDYNTVVGIIAGGDGAFVKAFEGAEDSGEFAVEDLIKHNLTSSDMVIGIAASGRTPYVIGGLQYAQSLGCKIASISCNKNSKFKEITGDLTIEVEPGPEVLTGSTRLKAGTATKLVLNMISTISMINNGKTYKNYMVDLKLSNEKLVVRGTNIVSEVTGISFDEAKRVLELSNNHVKSAIVMILLNCSYEEALEKLAASKGHISNLL